MRLSRLLPVAAAVALLSLGAATDSVPVQAAEAANVVFHDPVRPRVMNADAVHVAQGEPAARSGLRLPLTRSAASSGSASQLQRETFGFALSGSLDDPTVGYPSWDFSLLSTVAFFGLTTSGNGTITQDSNWSSWNSASLSGLVSTAHAHGTKVVVTIVLQDWSSDQASMCAGLANAAATVSQLSSQVRAKGVDGVNVDYEGYNTKCLNGSSTRSQFVAFLRSLRSALPGYYLSVSTYASSAVDSGGFFDIAGLAPSTDAFFVMAYDLDQSNYSNRPPGCSQYCLSPVAPLSGYQWNDSDTLAQYMSVVPASKVILGVPYYGRKSCVNSAAPNQVPTSATVADTYLDASTESSVSNVTSFAAHRDAIDASGQDRWDTWHNSTLNCSRELYWDDTQALGAKYDLVNRDGVRGVGFWNLNYGGGSPELWSLIRQRFTQGVRIGGYSISAPAIATDGSGRQDLFFAGSDNAVWHVWSTDNQHWGGWESLGGYTSSAPAAVSSGLGRLDVFVRGSDNAIWHRSWGGSTWAPWERIGGAEVGGPAVASWGAGRLDVVMRGTDNRVYHRAFANGAWQGWDSLGGYITSDPAAISMASGQLEVFARGGDNALWHAWWTGSAWSSWSSLGGQLQGAPGTGSWGFGRIDVAMVGTDGAVWRIWRDAAGWWSSWLKVGGSGYTSDPAVGDLPSHGMNVFLRGPDAAIYEVVLPA